jgi:hypothetical protein
MLEPSLVKNQHDALNLDAGAKSCTGVYDLLQLHLQQVSDCIFEHFGFLALGFLGFHNFLQIFGFRVSAVH